VARNDLEDQRQDGYDELVQLWVRIKDVRRALGRHDPFHNGTAKNIKVGALVTVTGTLKGMTIAGTKLDV